MAKSFQWTNDTRLGHMNTELDALWAQIDTNESDISDNASDIAALEVGASKYFIPYNLWDYDPGVANPAAPVYSLGATRNSALAVPTGATSIYMWSGFQRPDSWPIGAKVQGSLIYGLAVAGGALDAIRVGISAYGVQVGDHLQTAPTVEWSETIVPDISTYAASTLYQTGFSEISSTLTDTDFIGMRLVWQRNHATYTYASSIYFFGLELELV